jgi:hypothetical protein
MSSKPGRNDPCPCGSGKKYKKCCGLNAAPVSIIPESERTGTPFDDYMDVMPLLGIYAQKIRQFEKDGKELKKAASAFENSYHPGKPGGLTDSLFLSWMYLDLRFGVSRETIAERVLADPLTNGLVEPGPTLIRRLAESYLSFYEVVKASGDTAVLRELGTDQRWTVLYVRQLTETEAVPGEILYTRLVGPAEGALSYTTPYVFDPDSKTQFERAVKLQEKEFGTGPWAGHFARRRHFAESQKEEVLFWAEMIYRGMNADDAELASIPGPADNGDIPSGALPFLVNTDRESVVFTTDRFRVRDEPALRERMVSLKSFTYDAKDDSWTWLKAGNREDPEDPRTVRGTFRIRDGILIAETNSRERGARLRLKLEQFLGGLIVHQETRWRDQTELPEISKEEREILRRETDELNARPEVQELLRKNMEHYYFKKWPRQKIPMLGGITPVEAAKTEAGRRKLEDLFAYYDRIQNARRDQAPRLDLDRLRRLIGLPPKVS